MTGLSVILLYLAGIMPSGRLVLLGIASLPVAIMIMENGFSYGFMTYVSTGILFFIVSGNLKGLISYMVFFGIYPVIKNIAERLPFVIKEYALKFGFFNLSLYISVMAFKLVGIDFMMLVRGLKLPFGISDAKSGPLYIAMPYLLFAIAQIAFYVYDYGFSLLITYYTKRFAKSLNGNGK